MAREKILAAADRAASLNAGTFCMVISGRAPGARVFDKVLDAVREVKSRHDMHVCACLGLLTEDHVAFEDAGVDQVNHNSTARSDSRGIVTTHTFGIASRRSKT
jgi:biotin synthase